MVVVRVHNFPQPNRCHLRRLVRCPIVTLSEAGYLVEIQIADQGIRNLGVDFPTGPNTVDGDRACSIKKLDKSARKFLFVDEPCGDELIWRQGHMSCELNRK